MLKLWHIVSATLLVIGFIIGRFGIETDYNASFQFYQQMIPQAASFEAITDTTAKALDQDGSLIAYVGIGSNMSFGGPLLVGVVINPDGTLQTPTVIEHTDTPAWFYRVYTRIHQYEGMHVTDMFAPGYDVDFITGATITNDAINDVIRGIAHSIAIDVMELTPAQFDIGWRFGIAEILVAIIFAAGFFVMQVKKLRKYRGVVLGASMVVVGFWLNRVLSVTQFTSVALGGLPSPRVNMLFYIIMAGTLLPIIFSGKNLYCIYICPFGGLQALVGKISKKKIKYGAGRIWLVRLRNALLFVSLMVTFITGGAYVFNIEPFGIVFGIAAASLLTASSVMLVITGFFILASAVFNKLWCVGFCPVGAILDLAHDFRRFLGFVE